jgi:hypothetical protein
MAYRTHWLPSPAELAEDYEFEASFVGQDKLVGEQGNERILEANRAEA